ncbi:MAG: hypothetical protein JOZ21_10685 [Verrucomicrobia bacterium]|nr:hypothetical protein [Verrucomicrobiota bacterium]
MNESADTSSNELDEPLSSAASHPDHVADPCGRKTAIETLRRGPIGAVVVASIATACVLIIWYAFYFFAYIPRT